MNIYSPYESIRKSSIPVILRKKHASKLEGFERYSVKPKSDIFRIVAKGYRDLVRDFISDLPDPVFDRLGRS